MRFYHRLDFKISLIVMVAIFVSLTFASWLYLRHSLIWYQAIEQEQSQQLRGIIEQSGLADTLIISNDVPTQFRDKAGFLKSKYSEHIFVLVDSQYTPSEDTAPKHFMLELVRPDAEDGRYSVAVSGVWERADLVTIYVNVPGVSLTSAQGDAFYLLVIPKMTRPVAPLISSNVLKKFAQHLLQFGWVYLLMVASAVWVIWLNISPLRRLEKVAQALSDNRLPDTVAESGNNEVGRIIRAFNLASRQLAANQQQRERMIRDIAHELRTPITNIMGRIEAFEEGIVKDSAAVIRFTNTQLEGLASIVEDMQLLSSADANQLSVTLREINLPAMLQEWAEHYRDEPEIDGITVSSPCVDSMYLRLDPQRMTQVLDNLLTNARRARPSGLKISLETELPGKGCKLSFSDNGPGVPDESLPLLFQRLYRVDTSRNANTGGAGLGLSIVKTLVEAQNGRVEAIKTKQGGLCIEMIFPL